MDQTNYNTDSLQPHQKRVVEERLALGYNAFKLSEFIHGDIFSTLSKRQQFLLKKQLLLMNEYHEVLDARINAFYEEEDDFTRGENLIGFFGTEKWDVFSFKTLASSFINKIDELGKDGRLKAIATTDIERAQMAAVKSLF